MAIASAKPTCKEFFVFIFGRFLKKYGQGNASQSTLPRAALPSRGDAKKERCKYKLVNLCNNTV